MANLSTSVKHLALLAGMAVVFFGCESAENDPTGQLKHELCQAELALNERNYAKAQKIADKVVTEAFDGPNNWRRGNLLHNGFRIMGMAALENGDIEAAKAHLLNSAVTHMGSPQLNSFGPNMSLAQALLNQGEREFVLEYLNLCKRFWDTPELAGWIEEIEEGGTPNFGANLLYGVDLPGSKACQN